MARNILAAVLRASLLPAAVGLLGSACFVQPRSEEELYAGIPFLTDEACTRDLDEMCRSSNPCMRGTCSEVSLCLYEPDDSLIPDDGQECTVDSCADGVARHEPAAAGSSCGDGLSCDGKGACTGCGGDAGRCGAGSACLSWACNGDTCAPQLAPAGEVLPLAEQIAGDCAIRKCDGAGGVISELYDDPVETPDSACSQIDCFSGAVTTRPAGAPCGVQCGVAVNDHGVVQLRTCSETGVCLPSSTVDCDIGYACMFGECSAECSFESGGCTVGATCVDGKCVPWDPRIADCQASCEAREALGCPVDPAAISCQDACLQRATMTQGAACYDRSTAYLECLGATAKTVSNCAEYASACAAEYEALVECEGGVIPDGPGCTLQPCVSGFDGCSCAAYCNDATFADVCLPNADGTLTCTCAKDGVTVATCEAGPGCGIEKGCCKGAL